MEEKSELDELRRRAENILEKNPLSSPGDLSETDMLKIIHEMEVYKIELDLQIQENVLTR